MSSLTKYFCFLVLMFFTSSVFAQSTINFEKNDYQSVIEKSKKEKKPIFIMAYATWCPHCNKMKKEVLADVGVINFLNENFICYEADIDTKEGEFIKTKFGIPSYPAFLFLDENETLLYSFTGESKTDEFISECKNALIPTKQLPFLAGAFSTDFTNPMNCFAYLKTLKKGVYRSKMYEVASKYLSTQSESELLTETNWKIIAIGVTDFKTKEFQYVLSHKADYEKITSPQRVALKINTVVNKLITTDVQNLDTLSYYKNRILVKSLNSTKIDSLVFKSDLQITESLKDWKKYKQFAKESTEKLAWNDYTTLNDIIKNYVLYITETEDLKDAISWAKRSVELNNSSEANFLTARLYYKIKDKNAAIEYARKTKGIIKAMGWNTKEIDKFYLDLGIK